MAEKFDIGVVGAGYVGLVTGACLAHIGHRVTCVDKDAGRVEELREGRMPIYEPGLEEFAARGLRTRRLSLVGSDGLAEVVGRADVVFIAVDTPPGEDGSADLSSVGAVARSIGQALSETRRERPLVVVNKSTVPVGSGNYVSMLIREGATEVPVRNGSVDYRVVSNPEFLREGNKSAVPEVFGNYVSTLVREGAAEVPVRNGSVDYRVVSNPEFLREGSAVYDSLFPDRIVLGADGRDALDTMRALYEPIIEQSFPTEIDPRPRAAVPFVTTDLASAEMIKYAANAFLATKISFINEISGICELVGADVTNVAAGIGLDDRIGPRFLSAGIGWGGSCFPKDVAALRAIACEYDFEPALLDATVAVNERQRKQVIVKLQRDLHTLKGKRVALLGLAFKPNTDDLREAPSLEIARELDRRGARVVGYDPVAGEVAAVYASEHLPNLKVVFDPYEALRGAHAAVVVTEWEEIRNLDLEWAAALMEFPKLLVDGRNVMDPVLARENGLLYRGFGRG